MCASVPDPDTQIVLVVCAREMPPKKTKDAKVLFKTLFSNICCFITPNTVPAGRVKQVSQCIM